MSRPSPSRVRSVLSEAVLVTVLFTASAWWGTAYWKASWRAGRMPEFYQLNFEPAVMIACHRGFVVSQPQPAALADFLQRRVDAFSCGSLTPDVRFGTTEIFQGAWRYLMYAAGLGWRWLGISWSGMGPLFGVFFGGTVTLAYGIFRLAMGRGLSLAGACVLSVSTQQLVNLPHLRDYSKAPFTLALILLLGWLVKLRVRRGAVIALSALYGLVLGVGYGFRTDLLIDIPAIVLVLFLFLDGGVRQHLVTKLMGTAAFALMFLVTAWPILNAVYEKGGGQWHVALLGLSSTYDGILGIAPAPYDWGHVYSDRFVYKTSLAYASRVQPGAGDVAYGGHEYDVITGAYWREVVTRFPADMVTRGFASALQITGLPFDYVDPPLEGFATTFFRVRSAVLARVQGAGPYLAAAALLGAAAYDVRIGLFLLFCLIYFGGYPAIQFSYRHYFHFEFITWWCLGALLQTLIRRPPGAPRLRHVGVFVVAAAAVLILPLTALRLYQERQARSLLHDYLSAQKTPIALGDRSATGLYPLAGPQAIGDVRFIELDVNGSACSRLTFRYDANQPYDNFTRTIEIPVSSAQDVTHVFAPIYSAAFQGIEVQESAPACLAGAYWVQAGHRPLLLSATLAPGWERRPLFQRLRAERVLWR